MSANGRSTIQSTLEGEVGLCEHCVRLLLRPSCYQDTKYEASFSSANDSCPLCFGLLSSPENSSFYHRLRDEVNRSFKPYGGLNSNYVSRDAPTVVLPPIIMIRALCILGVVSNVIDRNYESESMLRYSDAVEIYIHIKNTLRASIQKYIADVRESGVCEDSPNGSSCSKSSNRQIQDLSLELHREEAGYMNFHIVFEAPKTTLPSLMPPFDLFPISTPERKKNRKRFRGNDPVDKQGGNPRDNLEKRIKERMDIDTASKGNIPSSETDDRMTASMKNESISKNNLATLLFDKIATQKFVEAVSNQNLVMKKLGEWMLKNCIANLDKEDLFRWGSSIPIHVAAWRNHFYVEGAYTKSKRDISQTPFYVPNCEEASKESNNDSESKGAMRKLGRTSVEEEICPWLSSIACNGISPLNNESLSLSNVERHEKCNGSDGNKGNVVYGMIKFHASGREDMDVRMILPVSEPPHPQESEKGNDESVSQDCKEWKKRKIASGRPFVCEVIDAYRMPDSEDLYNTVRAINGMNDMSSTDDESHNVMETIVDDDDCSTSKWFKGNASSRRYIQYGRNPNGVGVSNLAFCDSSSFKSLQSETEHKVKFYGMLCWSEKDIPSQGFLFERLVMGKGQMRTTDAKSTIYPLQIKQSTPLRVLHRRASSERIRHILSLQAKRINDHWFYLHLSTSAGTYVKEWCHGDCGRTYPSVSSLLGGKVDIVSLDCEGIAM